MDIMNLTLNDWVTCPFDPVHRMKYSRFYNHFVECRKKHPDDRRKQCPYNFSELIDPEHYEKHVSECPYQSLYMNMGQFNQLPKYDAPFQLEIVDKEEKAQNKRNVAPNQFVDSDEEFDSVSVANSGARPRFFSRMQLPSYKPPSKPVSVEGGGEKPTEKKGFGRGAWIRRVMEQKNSDLGASSSCNSVRSDESPKSRHDSSSDFSNDEQTEQFQFADFLEPYRNDPFKITKDFGRGRGAIFRTLLRD